MSKMITVRLREEVLARLDRERKRAGLTRAAAINEALHLWVAKRQYQEAVRKDQEGYARQPVQKDEFEPVLGAQRWPR
jgi:Arc/MetJ-type ribon-helix-helix transcriptional regulator